MLVTKAETFEEILEIFKDIDNSNYMAFKYLRQLTEQINELEMQLTALRYERDSLL